MIFHKYSNNIVLHPQNLRRSFFSALLEMIYYFLIGAPPARKWHQNGLGKIRTPPTSCRVIPQLVLLIHSPEQTEVEMINQKLSAVAADGIFPIFRRWYMIRGNKLRDNFCSPLLRATDNFEFFSLFEQVLRLKSILALGRAWTESGENVPWVVLFCLHENATEVDIFNKYLWTVGISCLLRDQPEHVSCQSYPTYHPK